MAHSQTILVTGATGQQGGAVAQSLLRQGQKVRVLTRNPDRAAGLVRQGAEVARGDLADQASLEQALQGVDGVFAMTTFLEAGIDAEVQQGIVLADAVKKAKIKHCVYTSVGSADRNTGIPHFETKWKIEQHIRELDIPATFLRPVWFMENFGTFSRPSPDGVLMLPLRPETKLQMIAVKDIGEFCAAAFLRPNEFIGQAIDLAGDELTMPEVTAHLSRTMGRQVRFQQMPDDQAEAALGRDFALMFRWFNEVGFAVDIPALQKRFGIPLTAFTHILTQAEWAKV